MNKKQWKEFCNNRYILLDGATGSNLMKAGMPAGVCPEKWILEHEEVLLELQKSYVEAGSNVIYAPTFTASRIKLQEYDLYEKQEEMIHALVRISKEAAAQRALVAGDITMTGQQLAPMGRLSLEELIDVYKEQVQLLEKAGVDLLVIETMMSLAETRAAVIAAKEVSELPILVTMTFEADGKTLFGTDAATAGIVLESLGVDALGVNCSAGPADMSKVIRDMAMVTTIPLIAKPNAGLPLTAEDGRTVYHMDAQTFAEEMKELINAGASILGGCCGTNPEYIKSLREMITKEKISSNECLRQKRKPSGIRYLTSERRMVSFGLDDNFILVGERINPTGKKQLQAELRVGNLERVLAFAEEQEQSGAQILDINLGMSGIDEKAMMLRVLEELQGVTNLPLSLDSSHVEVLEAALCHYPGRALVNSVSYEKEKIEKLLPIVKKYGAMFIALPLSDTGLPANAEAKKEIINKICESAYSIGLKKEDVIVDGLVTTVGANKNAGAETLETIRYCKEKGLATICGLSNISFGMPARSYVNSTFLTLAIQAGLTMAIANPNQELLVVSALASDLLLNKEGADSRYVEYASKIQTVTAEKTYDKTAERNSEKTGAKNQEVISDPVEKIKNAVLKGNRNGIASFIRAALGAGECPKKLLNEALLPAITQVGELFDQKKYFLPQLIAGAEAMKNAIEVLEPLLSDENIQQSPETVVIATVEGDIHDIGKNLVVMMLKNHGFNVIDLGKDVSAELIVKAAMEHKARVIGLSALMTTTMQKMREVVKLVKEKEMDCKVMIGGAVITSDFAQEIHADAYSSDAADAVKVVKRLLES